MLEERVEKHIRTKYQLLQHDLDERLRRLWAASEAIALGHGGVAAVSRATGLAESTIRIGCKQLREPEARGRERQRETLSASSQRVRRPGGGRKRLTEEDSSLVSALEILMEPCEGPAAYLRWTSKGTRKLAAELGEEGYIISHMKVAQILEELCYSLKTAARRPGFTCHPDSDAQFRFINEQIGIFHESGQLAISLEAIGNSLPRWAAADGNDKNNKNDGGDGNDGEGGDDGNDSDGHGSPNEPEAGLNGLPAPVIEDFATWCQREAYMRVSGWMERPLSNEAILFAGKILNRWWLNTGIKANPAHPAAHHPRHLLVIADVGDVKGETCELWKTVLQEIGDTYGIRISVCHIPNGTKKWNKIQQCTSSHIIESLPDKAFVRHEVTINLIACPPPTPRHPEVQGVQGIQGVDMEVQGQGIDIEAQGVDIRMHNPPGDDWNYTITPVTPPRGARANRQ